MLETLVYALLVVVIFGAAVANAFLPDRKARAVRKAERARNTASRATGADQAMPVPTTLEGALTAQLVRGDISRERYRQALEMLAARDDQTHPLSLPDKGDFSAGA